MNKSLTSDNLVNPVSLYKLSKEYKFVKPPNYKLLHMK